MLRGSTQVSADKAWLSLELEKGKGLGPLPAGSSLTLGGGGPMGSKRAGKGLETAQSVSLER